MNLHEYQSKAIFRNNGLPVPDGCLISTIDEAREVLDNTDQSAWVIKAQVHAGGRGKAGGVRLLTERQEAVAYIKNLLGSRLVTYQTDSNGQPVEKILIESPTTIAREIYLGAVIERSSQQVTFMVSTEGGVEIEKVAAETPDKIVTAGVHAATGIQPYQGRKLGYALALTSDQMREFYSFLENLYRLFIANDLSLVEINPLVITDQGKFLCVDAKVNIDDNALYRHPELEKLRDIQQENPREVEAREWDLNYISLDGDIGCMVNGAGLAMATMDLIKLHGGAPANFLDVGGTATRERVAEAFKIILSDTSIKGIFVNIFGGIVRCDLIAEGILAAAKDIGIDVPVVVRLEGNNAERGLDILGNSGLKITPIHGLNAAAEKIVELVRVVQ